MRMPTMRPACRVPPFFSAALSSVEAERTTWLSGNSCVHSVKFAFSFRRDMYIFNKVPWDLFLLLVQLFFSMTHSLEVECSLFG